MSKINVLNVKGEKVKDIKLDDKNNKEYFNYELLPKNQSNNFFKNKIC